MPHLRDSFIVVKVGIAQSATAFLSPSKKPTAKPLTRTHPTIMTTAKKNPCWPGYQPTPGKKPGTKGSCEPTPGSHSKSTKRATQKAAAASKLEKQGKPNPNARNK